MNEKKHELNTKDIIANLRVADTLLVKVIDFILSVPFLANPMLWKIGLVILILLLPLSIIITSITTLLGFAYMLMGNAVGIIVATVTIAYIVWLMKTTILNPESDLKIADLKGWSRMFMIVSIVGLFVSAAASIWISSIILAFGILIRSFISITITMYLGPFMARYLWGVVVDGLEHHHDSTHHPSNKKEDDDSYM